MKYTLRVAHPQIEIVPIGVSVNGLRVDTQLQGGEPQDLLLDLQWRLSEKPPENAHEGNLVRKSKPVLAGPTGEPEAREDLRCCGSLR